MSEACLLKASLEEMCNPDGKTEVSSFCRLPTLCLLEESFHESSEESELKEEVSLHMQQGSSP